MSFTTIDAAILTLHELLGHDKAAAFLGVPVGDKTKCRLCTGKPIDYGDGDVRVLGRKVKT